MSKSRSILIVEDEAVIALMEQQKLQEYGYEVFLAHNRVSTIEIISGEQQIDLILMDIDLGEGNPDGTEVAREVLLTYNIPIIFVSSHTEPEIVDRTERISSYGYIVKGCSDTVFLASIRMAFRLHRSYLERESAYRAQKNTETYLRTLMETSPEGIWVSNEDGMILDVNLTYCNMSGYSKDELIGRYARDIDASDKFPEIASRIKERKPGQIDKFETWHYRKNGEILHIEASVTKFNFNTEIELVTYCRKWSESEAVVNQLQEALKQLSDQSRRLHGVIDGTNVGTWEWNVQTNETIFNDRWAEIIGYSIEELQPVSFKTWERFVHPEDLKKTSIAMQKHFEGKADYYECAARMKHRNGNWIWVMTRGRVSTWAENGKPEWVFGTHNDITEQKRLEDNLRKSEKQFRSLFENMEMGFALHRVIRNEKGRIVDYEFMEANTTFGALTGLDPESITGRKVTEVLPGIENDLGRWIERYAEVTETGKSVHFESFSNILNRWYSVTAYRPQAEMFATLFYDTTDYRRVLEDLEQAQNIGRVGSWINNKETGTVKWSDEIYRIFGYKPDTEKTPYEIFDEHIHPDDKDRFWNEIIGAMDDESLDTFNMEFRIRTSDGKEKTLAARSQFIRSEKKIKTGVRGTLQDITERVEKEKILEEALVNQKILLEELNHRVKNNLFMVISLIHLKNIETGAKVDLSDVESQVKAIANLHEELQHTATLDRVPLHSYIKKIAENVTSNYPQSVELAMDLVELEISTRKAVSIGLIINEIITNALKHGFSAGQSPRIEISSRLEGGESVITVSNNGRPFPEDVTMENSGTLGLKLISTLVKQINGVVDLKKTPHPEFTIRYKNKENTL